VDGLLAINPYADGRHRRFEQLITQGAAIVYYGVGRLHTGVSAVSLDDENGAHQLTRHLIQLGHTHIAMLTGPRNEDCVQDRSAGFERAVHEAGLSASSDIVWVGDWSATSGYEAMQHWLTDGADFTALFAQNDRMAVGAIKAARDYGRLVPRDLAVVGFDDMPLASYFDPPLTTIRQDIFEQGRRGARMLIEKIEDPSRPSERVVLPAQLIVRESCGARLVASSHSSFRAPLA
jgi:DNA-binding LacI/PurR family transcriptional regulator